MKSLDDTEVVIEGALELPFVFTISLDVLELPPKLKLVLGAGEGVGFGALPDVAVVEPPKLNDDGADGAGALVLDTGAEEVIVAVVPPNVKPPVAGAGAGAEVDGAGAAGAPKENVVPLEAGGGAPNVNPAIRLGGVYTKHVY